MAKAKLTHLDAKGAMHMVDVGSKAPTRRTAVAEALVRLSPAARRALTRSKKGDVLAAARLAGIQGAKRTSELIPLCHPLALTHLGVQLERTKTGVRVVTRAETVGPTGVEMEAMTGAAIAALTLYDMLKAVDRSISLGPIRLLEKRGGKSGAYTRTR